MIENEYQLKVAKRRLAMLRTSMKELWQEHPRTGDFEFFSKGVRLHINQIEAEIRAYLAGAQSKNDCNRKMSLPNLKVKIQEGERK